MGKDKNPQNYDKLLKQPYESAAQELRRAAAPGTVLRWSAVNAIELAAQKGYELGFHAGRLATSGELDAESGSVQAADRCSKIAKQVIAEKISPQDYQLFSKIVESSIIRAFEIDKALEGEQNG